jgi:hypothetical protein
MRGGNEAETGGWWVDCDVDQAESKQDWQCWQTQSVLLEIQRRKWSGRSLLFGGHRMLMSRELLESIIWWRLIQVFVVVEGAIPNQQMFCLL